MDQLNIIKYFVTEYQSGKSVTFQFELTGFNGFHRFDINELEPNKTETSHIILKRQTK